MIVVHFLGLAWSMAHGLNWQYHFNCLGLLSSVGSRISRTSGGI